MSTLARQGASYQQPWSLDREAQRIGQHETAATQLFGYGVVAGGIVSVVTGFTLRVPSGTSFFAEGVYLSLSASQDYTAAVASSTVYVWAQILRTAADQSAAANLDTFALDVTHNTTGVAPSSIHFPLVIARSNLTTFYALDNAPDAKFVRAASPLWRGRLTIASTDAAGIDSTDELVRSSLTVAGYVGIGGVLVLV